MTSTNGKVALFSHTQYFKVRGQHTICGVTLPSFTPGCVTGIPQRGSFQTYIILLPLTHLLTTNSTLTLTHIFPHSLNSTTHAKREHLLSHVPSTSQLSFLPYPLSIFLIFILLLHIYSNTSHMLSSLLYIPQHILCHSLIKIHSITLFHQFFLFIQT